MRGVHILQRQLERELATVHLARVRAVFAAVCVAVRGAKLSLTELGRAIAKRTSAKHGIKRMDRLLGNKNLHTEQTTFYRAMAHRLVSNSSQPVVLVDWTSVTPTLWALVAAVPCDGRALTIYAEAHPISRYMKPQTNASFLKQLKRVLPADCTPTIITDAGFRSPWMKLVSKLGWNYVCRVRQARVRIRTGKGWLYFADLWENCRTVARDFGVLELGMRARFKARIVGIRKRRAIMTRVRGRPSDQEKARRTAMEPWILATSLGGPKPSEIVGLYRLRMQIEETFRDNKSHRFGMSLNHARTKSEDRANILLLLASLSHLFAVLIGFAAEALDLQRHYQANTVRHKRVLSLATLGRLVAAEPVWPLPRGAIIAAWRTLPA